MADEQEAIAEVTVRYFYCLPALLIRRIALMMRPHSYSLELGYSRTSGVKEA